MKRKNTLNDDKVKVIKISREALFECIYENFIDNLEDYFDVDPLDVTSTFDINYDTNEFIFCVYSLEKEEGFLNKLSKELDLQ